LEESKYWLELLGESGLFGEEKFVAVKQEAGELKGIFVSIMRITKARTKAPNRQFRVLAVLRFSKIRDPRQFGEPGLCY
jgi:hypothetical protein